MHLKYFRNPGPRVALDFYKAISKTAYFTVFLRYFILAPLPTEPGREKRSPFFTGISKTIQLGSPPDARPTLKFWAYNLIARQEFQVGPARAWSTWS